MEKMNINSVRPMLKVEAHGRSISSFILQHLISAVLFARRVGVIEHENLGQPFGEFFTEIRSYASASIMASTAALEANINELFIDHGGLLRGKTENYDKKFWGRNGIEAMPLLKKYLKALNIMNINNDFEKEQVYKDANCLIIIRNELTHFKPNWDFEPEDKRIELKDILSRFKCSPFADEGAHLISMKCMSYSCAKWGVETAIQFIDTFSDLSGMPNRVKQFRNKLNLDEDFITLQANI